VRSSERSKMLVAPALIVRPFEMLSVPPVVARRDAETGEQLVIDSGDPLLRARLRDAVGERDASLAAGMRRAGVPVHRIDTTADLATALVEIVASSKRRRS